MVRFDALESALIRQNVAQGVVQGTENDAQNVAQGSENDAQGVAQGNGTVIPLDDLQKEILQLIKGNHKISREEIARKCNKSVKTIERRLSQMKDLVKYVGRGYSGHWEVTVESSKKTE